MNADEQWLREQYQDAFRSHLRDPSERSLHAMYELGREAVSRRLSLLVLSDVHHGVLGALLDDPAARHRPDDIVSVGAELLREALSAFLIVQDGFWEEREAARFERTQAGMLRQLSSFLGDASLALDGSGSAQEMLLLVADQAREAVMAHVSLVSLRRDATSAPQYVVSYSDDATWTAALRPEALVRERPPSGQRGPIIVGGALRQGWLAAPLTMLDGRTVGWIDVIDRASGRFGELDEAVLLHLAQMASAAVERAGFYAKPHGGRS